MIVWALVALALLGFAVCWLRSRYVAVTVTGPSMEPTYRHGDRVLVRRMPLAKVRAGQVVVIAAPDRILMIKRAAALPGDPVPALLDRPEAEVPAGSLVVLSDNTRYRTDSRWWGYLDGRALLGVVVGTLSAARRIKISGRVSPPAGQERRIH